MLNEGIVFAMSDSVEESQVPSIVQSEFTELGKLKENLALATRKAQDAHQSAERAKSKSAGLFQKREAIELLQSATADLADAQVSAAEAQELSFKYQEKLAQITKYLFGLGVSNIAVNRMVVRELELKLRGASQEELDDLTRKEVAGVIKQLKAQEDIMKKQAFLSDKVKRHEEQLCAAKQRADVQDKEIKSQSDKYKNFVEAQERKEKEKDRLFAECEKKNEEQDRLLTIAAIKNEEQDRLLTEGIEKDKEQDRLLTECIEKDKEQDHLLAEGAEKDKEQDRLLAEGAEKDKKQDQLLAEGIEKDREQDQLLAEGIEKNKEQDQLLAEGIEKDREQDRLLAEGIEKGKEQDRLLAEEIEKNKEQNRLLTEEIEKNKEQDRLLTEGIEKDKEQDQLLAEGIEKNQEQDHLIKEQGKEIARLQDEISELKANLEKKMSNAYVYGIGGVSIAALILAIVQFFI